MNKHIQWNELRILRPIELKNNENNKKNSYDTQQFVLLFIDKLFDFMQCIPQRIVLTHIYNIFSSNWNVSSNQIIKVESGPEIEALQIRRWITTSTISKLSFMNADTRIIFVK